MILHILYIKLAAPNEAASAAAAAAAAIAASVLIPFLPAGRIIQARFSVLSSNQCPQPSSRLL